MANYDTEKILRVAGHMRRLSQCVSSEISPAYAGAMQDTEVLQGRTSRAMEEGLADFRKQAAAIHEDLDFLARQLEKYADALIAADQQIAESF